MSNTITRELEVVEVDLRMPTVQWSLAVNEPDRFAEDRTPAPPSTHNLIVTAVHESAFRGFVEFQLIWVPDGLYAMLEVHSYYTPRMPCAARVLLPAGVVTLVLTSSLISGHREVAAAERLNLDSDEYRRFVRHTLLHAWGQFSSEHQADLLASDFKKILKG